jgi:hypothetical protein
LVKFIYVNECPRNLIAFFLWDWMQLTLCKQAQGVMGVWKAALAPAHRNRTGVPPRVVALEAAEVLARGPRGKAIAWDRRVAQPLEALRPLALVLDVAECLLA